jgi:hypothetical protein
VVHIIQGKLPVRYIRRCSNPESTTLLPCLTPYNMIVDTCFKTTKAFIINKKTVKDVWKALQGCRTRFYGRYKQSTFLFRRCIHWFLIGTRNAVLYDNLIGELRSLYITKRERAATATIEIRDCKDRLETNNINCMVLIGECELDEDNL